MPEIIYRPYQDEDAPAVKEMIDEAFYVHRYAKAPHLLHSALEVYLRERLVASTYARVAVRDGHAVGVIMGQVQGQPRLPGRFTNRLRTWAHMAKIALTGVKEYRSLLQYFAFTGVYRNLRANAGVPLNDELTLFAVDASTRGAGVGKQLYRDYLDHLRSHGRSDFYLYTDSLCIFQFYERQGMTRAAEESLMLRFDGEPEDVGVYLYAGTA